jgi:hypothetical protein
MMRNNGFLNRAQEPKSRKRSDWPVSLSLTRNLCLQIPISRNNYAFHSRITVWSVSRDGKVSLVVTATQAENHEKALS